MTLGRLFRLFFGEDDVISCPPYFLDLEVENYEGFCFFALKKYFESEKFQQDIKKCTFDYDFAEQEGLFQCLRLEKNNNGEFTIYVNPYFLDD